MEASTARSSAQKAEVVGTTREEVSKAAKLMEEHMHKVRAQTRETRSRARARSMPALNPRALRPRGARRGGHVSVFATALARLGWPRLHEPSLTGRVPDGGAGLCGSAVMRGTYAERHARVQARRAMGRADAHVVCL